jgi:hypothetical protein
MALPARPTQPGLVWGHTPLQVGLCWGNQLSSPPKGQSDSIANTHPSGSDQVMLSQDQQLLTRTQFSRVMYLLEGRQMLG